LQKEHIEAQVNSKYYFPRRKIVTCNKHDKDPPKGCSVHSEWGVLLPVSTSAREWVGVRASEKSPPASQKFSATPLKLLIRQIKPMIMPNAPQG